MPNRDVHAVAGLVAGLATGLATATLVAEEHQAVHILVCALSGVGGGLVPDFIEPALSPNHRSLAHSFVAVGGLALAVKANYHAQCLKRATACEQRAVLLPVGCPEWRAERRTAATWRVMAASTLGFVAGYASHLALDGATPKGLPVVAAGS
jgi:hypothetical protein